MICFRMFGSDFWLENGGGVMVEDGVGGWTTRLGRVGGCIVYKKMNRMKRREMLEYAYV
jgi:hypothetical protein